MSDLVKRLRGQYEVGPDAEFGERDFSDFIPPIHFEAADKIESLQAEIATLVEDLNYQQTISNAAQKELIALKPQWVSVEDKARLPATLGGGFCRVLVSSNGAVDFALFNEKIKKFHSRNFELMGDDTHWMALPPSPEAE